VDVISTLEAARLTGGELTGESGLVISGLLTDSRQTLTEQGTAFFAIKGSNHDGHKFIDSLYKRGVRIFFVTEKPLVPESFPGAAFILVKDTIEAMQRLAAAKRERFKGRVIAVTGSAGKTVVKEWLADVAGRVWPVIRSPRSYNSQIGVPLSVWKLDNRYSAGIIEAGISMPGEMEKLQKIINPETGIITNIGDAHAENFRNDREKASEKLKLFSSCREIVFCSDHELVRELIYGNKSLSSKKLFSWSLGDSDATVNIKAEGSGEGRTYLKVKYGNISFKTFIPFTDKASVANAATVITAALATGIESDVIAGAMPRLSPVAMRMEIKSGINGCLLIEDYYNSDPGSLRMALEHLKSYNGRNPVLIMSDILQSGRDEEELYSEVARLVSSMNISRFIGIGPGLSAACRFFPPGSTFYESTPLFCAAIGKETFSNEVILLKGARKFEFERISNLLVEKIHQTLLEINLNAIAHNLTEIRKHLNPSVKIMAMVKAFAYGAGAAGIAQTLEYHRVDYLAVANADEGADLRENGVTLPVVVMNPEPGAFDLMIRYNLEPEIYSFPLLRNFISAAARHGLTGYPVHIKIDTGMHRLGFMPGEAENLAKEIVASGQVRIASVFSHLSSAENPEHDSFTRSQADTFKEVSERIRAVAGYNFIRHLLNTQGIMRFPEYQFEMVRPGIGLYGIESTTGYGFRQALRYITRILQIKTVPAGQPVGYGCSDISERERRIAILPAGYADGIDRRSGNGKGGVFINNRYAPFAGTICMDLSMADITGIEAKEGDEAEIFGGNITIDNVAAATGRIPYEILTSIPHRVKRIFSSE